MKKKIVLVLSVLAFVAGIAFAVTRSEWCVTATCTECGATLERTINAASYSDACSKLTHVPHRANCKANDDSKVQVTAYEAFCPADR